MSENDPQSQNTPPKEPASPAEEKAAEAEKKYLYLYAEFENFKKRAFKERQDALKFGWEPVARGLLEVLDNLERAQVAATQGPEAGRADLLKGLELVIREFRATLQRGGVHQVELLHKPFDPNWAEAVGQVPSDSPAGTVCQEITKGYSFHGRLLRPARVHVSQGTINENTPLTEGEPKPS